MQDFVRVMKALSDPGRVKIVKMLEQREMCACEITPLLGLAQPTVSRHLKVLTDAGLILGRRAGAWIHYRLPTQAENPYVFTMLEHLRGWLDTNAEVHGLILRMGPGPAQADAAKGTDCGCAGACHETA